MLAALLVSVALAASPEAAPTSTAGAAKTLKIAAPGLEAVDVDPKKAQFLNDYLAEQVGRRSDGRIQVITQSEVTALIGLERQKTLLGCSEGSTQCLTEISNALGADGLIVGNVAKFGDTFAMTIKVLGANDAKPLFSASNSGMKEAQLVDWVKQVSIDLVARLDPGSAAAAGAPGGPQLTAPAVHEPPKLVLWLNLVGAELDYRLRGASWIGLRAGGAAGKLLDGPGFSGNAQLLAMARYMNLSYDQKWGWSAFTGLGFGRIARSSGGTDLEDTPNTFALTLGVEGSYKVLHLSGEVMMASGHFSFIPNLAISFGF